MAKQKRNTKDYLTVDDLKGVYGGVSSRSLDLAKLQVKCPVAGCKFECRTFGEMNIHMHTVHPERC